MMMLESRLNLNVGIVAAEPFDDFFRVHPVKDRVLSPESLTFPPGVDDVCAAFGL